MTDLEPPSFSLGLESEFDNGIETEPDEFTTVSNILNPQSCVIVDSNNEEEEQNDRSTWSFDSPQTNLKKKLKRLRRGQLKDDVSISDKISDVSSPAKDEDIEEFSSQDELASETRNSTLYNSVCSSSKIPLQPSKLQTNNSSIFFKSKIQDQTLSPLFSHTLDLGYNGVMLPNLTISPLRRFQLIDSDSDPENPPILKSEPRKERIISSASNEGKKTKQKTDLWEDFEPLKTSKIETPVLDEICNEYFNSLHRNAIPKRGHSASHRFPAHHYYFNDDERIRNLVSSRLPHFTPLTGEAHKSNINYIGQFKEKGASSFVTPARGKGQVAGASKTAARGTGQVAGASKTATRRKGKQMSTQGGSNKPKNVAKRRVVANNSQGSGYWYTSSDGKRVYVSKSGDELSGQEAYSCYKKETGQFKKSKYKVRAKKKS